MKQSVSLKLLKITKSKSKEKNCYLIKELLRPLDYNIMLSFYFFICFCNTTIAYMDYKYYFVYKTDITVFDFVTDFNIVNNEIINELNIGLTNDLTMIRAVI